MTDWNNGADTWGVSSPDPYQTKGDVGADTWNGASNNAFEDTDNIGAAVAEAGDKCFGCGEEGHRRADCPNAGEIACRYCKKEGHMIKDCPDKPPMICENCGEEGHFRRNCEKPRKINRDHIADVSADEAWENLKRAVAERDADDAKEAVQEYVKAVETIGGTVTYRDIQAALIDMGINLWLIATERSLVNVFTNMDLQGNIGKKYSISYRFSEKPERPREIDAWPQSREDLLSRLDDAGEVISSGLPKCYNCDEIGHTSKTCTQEKAERNDKPKISCYNCGGEGHRVRDCPEPRVDRFACKNCGKSGHKAADCEEPPNLDNVECRNCNKTGHFSRDCPDGGGRACRNCGQEGHMAKECDQPRNMDSVTCRNCEKSGHFSKDCPEPKDWSKVQWSNCEEFGHTKVRCKPPKESEEFGQGGFSGTTAEQPDGQAFGHDNFMGNTGHGADQVATDGW